MKTPVRTMAEILTSHPDPAERSRAARELGRTGGDTTIAALAQALRDPSKEVRAAAAAALASAGPPALGVLEAALADGDWVVRYRAAEALGAIRDPRSVSALLRTLGDGRDHVRYMAAKGLGRLGARGAAGPLRAALADENPFVRRAARAALAALE
jgi:hypothetical protein